MLWKSQNNVRPFCCQCECSTIAAIIRNDNPLSNGNEKSEEQAKYIDEITLMKLKNNVPVQESEQEIKETLEEYGYSAEQAKRFKKMQMVMITLSKAEEVMKILQDKNIQIGYSMAQAIKTQASLQAISKLNHIAKECPQKKTWQVLWPEKPRSIEMLTQEGNKNKNKVVEQQPVQKPQNNRKDDAIKIIGGDWNAHHPACLDHNTDDVFIVSNGLNIINTLPFNCTFMKDNATTNRTTKD
ncbi:hypothetical protein RFI_00870 [Reticulomyxa filosa]|uniref:Endonuclease/exonuclease/phosphatase domain-containing protein n=1 Tax=Reticulomyxa filosa TaxID=46433 RepID=X6PDK9_RETFI|nr:hypothetical protein RFI_00870 [Reticulomyxa filosa]|eukprot:ETO36193.1 hypothetical protein RFI_00870 [Reticulomyxa filosa]